MEADISIKIIKLFMLTKGVQIRALQMTIYDFMLDVRVLILVFTKCDENQTGLVTFILI